MRKRESDCRQNLEQIMRTSLKILAPALFATMLSMAGPAGAAPLSSSLALKNSDAAAVETVQWRRHHRYYHRYSSARRHYRGSTNGSYRGCTGDEGTDSAFPSWQCQ